MAIDDDDENKPVKTNASPVFKPPGLGLGGHAPSGAVGTERAWVEGPFFIGGHGENLFRRGGGSEPLQEQPLPEDKTTPRFLETDDPDVNRLYGQDHIMVREDGSEMRPSEWNVERSNGDAEEKSLADDGGKGHDSVEGEAPEREANDDIRPQLWEDLNKREDDGIDR